MSGASRDASRHAIPYITDSATSVSGDSKNSSRRATTQSCLSRVCRFLPAVPHRQNSLPPIRVCKRQDSFSTSPTTISGATSFRPSDSCSNTVCCPVFTGTSTSSSLVRTGTADALYTINRPILAVMLNVTRSPSALEARAIASASSTIERAAAVIEEPLPATEEARHRRIRCRLVRALLDDPILCFSDLDGGERAYLQSQRRYLLPQIHEATGLVPEIRREGIAMVDDAAELTDLKLPKEGTDGHLTLLLAEWLATQARDCPGVSVPFSAVEQHIANLIRVYCSRW